MRLQRSNNELRKISIKPNFMENAYSSCLIKFGNTKVICSVTIENHLPRWLKGSGKGWITAEYAMLPTSTHTRTDRESIKGKLSGRTQEIQRLIGRSLRNCVDLSLLSEILIKIDCDVLLADGGTRTTAINGSWIALSLAIKKLVKNKLLFRNPIRYGLSAVSCGMIGKDVLLDLDYKEDSSADADANFVFTNNGNIVEIQCTGEQNYIEHEQFIKMYTVAKEAAKEIYKLQMQSIEQTN
ncbi:ribonuclease PH [Pelagibacteraceae bacterium]|nr:ribonuclease PH [Pelagibacteraceae bacterium]